jgi:hypothetical protein
VSVFHLSHTCLCRRAIHLEQVRSQSIQFRDHIKGGLGAATNLVRVCCRRTAPLKINIRYRGSRGKSSLRRILVCLCELASRSTHITLVVGLPPRATRSRTLLEVQRCPVRCQNKERN